ncbi:hypothetical protein CCHL11_09501 [Colletotrichum chlorophyti]|uniref:Uncharacterized protein n=1 Tax=Colletotrichum chlorophyti TaxID=708187 RepID=A0A1Q8RXC5_9PEZI|nr:hypothetical protein CCHL11_09501 [Colletotrichum chlorophyti]
MNQQDQQPLRNHKTSSSSCQTAPIQSTHPQRETGDLLRKLQENTISALRTSSNTMDSRNSYSGGSSKGTSPDSKGKGYDQTAMFDGLLPRIDTRGQSKSSSKKSSGKKKEDKSSN